MRLEFGRGNRRQACAYVALVAAGLWLTEPVAVRAQTFPSGTVRVIVPFAAGGNADVLARGLAAGLTELWGQQVYVENKGGANTQIGATEVAKAPKDGHTLMVTSEGTFVMNPFLFSKLSYDPAKDFAPITALVALKQVLMVNNSVTANNVKELITLAKSKPDGLTYGTTGAGSSSHLNAEMLQDMAGIKLVAVHYKGSGPAMNDLLGGHIQMMFAGVGIAIEQHQAGKLRILATGSKTPVEGLSQIPTIADSGGLAGFDGTSWFGLFAPSGTPKPIIDKINADVRKIFDDAAFQERFLKVNKLESMITSAEEFAASIDDGRARWGKVIRDANLKMD
jgi:tripartite-type tricarboxylate transporter receptor subunit TctC